MSQYSLRRARWIAKCLGGWEEKNMPTKQKLQPNTLLGLFCFFCLFLQTFTTSLCVRQPSFFVVYNMVSTEVLAVFENTSDQLLELFENFCDLFRNATLHSQAVQFPCSASSNNYARQVQRRYRRILCTARSNQNTDLGVKMMIYFSLIRERGGLLLNENRN